MQLGQDLNCKSVTMKVIEKTEEKMFGRVALTISIQGKGKTTPARSELQKSIATNQKADAKLVVVTNIKSVTGTPDVTVTAHVYSNEKFYKQFVPAYLQKKSVIVEAVKEEPKVEEPKVEEPKVETPAEPEASA